jgi:hypothetical protein
LERETSLDGGLKRMIFSDFVRTDANHRKFSERRFSHINRSAEPEYFRIRELLESWAAHVPDPERFQFEQRIQSGDDRAFDSAFFELYIHELHLRTGQNGTNGRRKENAVAEL